MVIDLHKPTDTEVFTMYLRSVRQKKHKVGLASGTFDLIHYHHSYFLDRCRRQCDLLVVGVDSDEVVKEAKGPGRPFIYDSRRAFMVDNLKPVAFTFIMNSIEDFGLAAQIIRPDIIFKNDAFYGREKEILGKEFAKRIIIVPDVIDHQSTTAIINHAVKILAIRQKKLKKKA